MEALSKVHLTDTVETSALQAIDIEVSEKEFIAVTGSSDCGKPTLLNLVGLLDSPSSGSYCFLGEEMSAMDESRLALVRRDHIVVVFQNFNLVDELNVRENVEFDLLYHDVSAHERKAQSTDIMERMKIAHRARHMPSQLSGGQQQRVAVAGALITEPTLILADEPTGNLDSKNGREVMNILRSLNEQGVHQIRNVLVLLQFTVSIILMAVSLVIYSQIKYSISAPLGFDAANMAIIQIGRGEAYDIYKSLRARLLEHSDVVSVTRSSIIPTGNLSDGRPCTRRVVIRTTPLPCEW
jgi:putative ABC transport system ATP-binding protein